MPLKSWIKGILTANQKDKPSLSKRLQRMQSHEKFTHYAPKQD